MEPELNDTLVNNGIYFLQRRGWSVINEWQREQVVRWS